MFLAFLNGFQSHFRMVGGMESARSVAHFCELFVLADQAGVLRDPELAMLRMRAFCAGRCRMSLLDRLSFNQITADPWSLEQVVRNCSQGRIPYIAVWRHKLDGDVKKAAAMIRSEGLRVSSLCRGGWFSAPTAQERRERIADNRVAIEEAAILGAPVLVIVSGPANGQTLEDARATVLDGLLEVLPDAEKAGVILGVEPLHPMYAAERSVVVTLKQANDIVQQMNSSCRRRRDRCLPCVVGSGSVAADRASARKNRGLSCF